jgi:hypothetical protein
VVVVVVAVVLFDLVSFRCGGGVGGLSLAVLSVIGSAGEGAGGVGVIDRVVTVCCCSSWFEITSANTFATKDVFQCSLLASVEGTKPKIF